MHNTDEPAPGSAEDVFGSFLERIEAGEQVDFEALCRQHPHATGRLRRIHLRWLAMTRAFGELSRAPAATAPDGSSAAVDALMARLQSGTGRAARYAIGTEIARGAMGRIVQAWDEELRREVALKVHRGESTDPRQRRRFLEEAQIAAQLDHPGIVPIHELGVDPEGRPFFSMRLVRGADLGEILALANEGKGEWTRTRLLHVLLRVCEAMAFAHARGVVHRDLKPANIMVGRFHETYVMDWGLAHVRGVDGGDAPPVVDSLRATIAGEGDDSPLLTGHGDVLGTPAYMAPEQALGGSGSCRPAVDVYALGAILWHVLAGRMPFAEHPAPTATTILDRVRAGPPRPLPTDVPPELRAICEKAMARSPDERYASVAELGSDLRAYLEVRTVRAYATGRFAELRKWVARNRALTASVLLLLLVGIGAGIAVTRSWLRADAHAERLRTELDRNAFRSARQSLQLGDSSEAGDLLWRSHLEGRMPRATTWALCELAERDPYLVTLPIHRNERDVAFAPHVDAVLAAESDGTLAIHDPTTLASRDKLGEPGPSLTSLTAPTDSAWAVAGNRAGFVLVYDLAAGRVVRNERVHEAGVTRLVMTGRTSFASGGADGRVFWFEGPTAAAEPMLAQQAPITALVAHPAGDGIVAGDDAGFLRGRSRSGRWSLDRRTAATQLTALAFGTTSTDLWIGATDHLLRHLDLKSGGERSWPTRNGTYRQLARDTDGSLLAGGWWRTDHRTVDGTVLPPIALRGISRFAFDPTNRRLVTSGVASGLGLVDTGTRDRRRIPGANVVALSADGRRIAFLRDGHVVVRDVDTDTRYGVPVLSGPTGLSLSPDGELIAIFTPVPPRVHVHETATGVLRFASEGPLDAPFGAAAAFAPDGTELAVRVGSDQLRRLRCRDGQILDEQQLVPGRCIGVAYTADGRFLAAGASGGTAIRVFDRANGTHRDEAFSPVMTTGVATTISAFAIAPDGSRLAIGTWQGAILVRESDGTTVTIAAHPGTIWSLQFVAADPGLLASSGAASGISFWDLDTRECCYQTARDQAEQMQVAADGRTLVCVLPDGALVQDLSYRQRHVAGNLEYHLDRHRAGIAPGSPRESALRAWAAATLALPWPRWK